MQSFGPEAAPTPPTGDAAGADAARWANASFADINAMTLSSKARDLAKQLAGLAVKDTTWNEELIFEKDVASTNTAVFICTVNDTDQDHRVMLDVFRPVHRKGAYGAMAVFNADMPSLDPHAFASSQQGMPAQVGIKPWLMGSDASDVTHRLWLLIWQVALSFSTSMSSTTSAR